MTPEEEQSNEHQQRLEKLSDWMIKSGLAVRHGHTEQRVGIELTPHGINLVKMFYHLDKSFGSDHQQRQDCSLALSLRSCRSER